jgi:hypothetical protein
MYLLQLFSSGFEISCVSKLPSQQRPSVLRRLVAGLSPRRPGFTPGTVHVGFVVDNVALRQGFLRVLRSSPVNIISPWLSTLIYHLGNEQQAR